MTKPFKGRFADLLVCLMILSVAAVTPAYAYLDPASGAAVTSAILGFFAAIAYVVRKQFYKLVRMFKGQ